MSAAPRTADLVMTGGVVRTLDAALPEAQAVAIRDGRIWAVGDDAEILTLASPGTQRVDLGGRLCLPGFFDSHFHFYQWSLGRRDMDFAAVVDFAGAMRLIEDRARNAARDAWLTGYGFNESDWPENRMPDRRDLDRAGGGRPVLIWRCDLHLAVASTEALRLAGVNDGTPDPPDGAIGRDDNGQLSGVLREGAVNLVRNHIPESADSELKAAMAEGIGALHALGVTALHDVRLSGVEQESARTFRMWQTLHAEERLDLRCWSAIPGESLRHAVDLGLATGLGDDRLRVGHVKYFMDGGMGARTGWVLSPYLDTGRTGVCLFPPEELARDVRLAHDNGLAVMIHAIGDRASREVVGIYESLYVGSPGPGPVLPHRIEHAQMIRPEDIARLSGMPVAVSAQPPNMILDINMIDACMGELGRHAYPFKALADSGTELMFSSDCPVCDPNPLVGIHAAVNRARADGTPEGGWHPGSKVGVERAVRAYTAVPARVHGAGGRFGTIRSGLHADLAVLDKDIFTIDPMEIVETRVDMTLFDGEIVFNRG